MRSERSGDYLRALTVTGRILALNPFTFFSGLIMLIYVAIKRFQEELSDETEP